MATLGSMNSKEKKDFWQALFDPTKLQALRPSTKHVTTFRPIPQIAPDGAVLPMVMGHGVSGLDFSNFTIESAVEGSGVNHKFTGFTRATDSSSNESVHHVFSGLFIRLRGRQKKNELPAGTLGDKIKDLLAKRKVGKSVVETSAIAKPTDYAILQCIVLSYNSQPCNPLRVKQAILLPTTASLSLNKLLTQCHKDGKDVFNPDSGYCVNLVGVPADLSEGRPVPVFRAELGDQVPLPLAKCQSLWTPWESAKIMHDTAWHIREAIKCFGADVVEFAFPDEFAMYGHGVQMAQPKAPATTSVPQTQQAVAPRADDPVIPAQSNVRKIDIPDDMPPPPAEEEHEEAAAPPPSVAKAGKLPTPEETQAKYKALLQGL